MTNKYDEQAERFLKDTESTISIIEATGQGAPLWVRKGEKHGICYEVTLKSPRGRYAFAFWDSLNKAEETRAIKALQAHYFSHDQNHYEAERTLRAKGYGNARISQIAQNKAKRAEAIAKLTPSPYDVLACLSLLDEDTFGDFCSSFGYDEDSMTARDTFEACKEQDRNLRKLYTLEQLDALSEIN
jgi:hypothetical protein